MNHPTLDYFPILDLPLELQQKLVSAYHDLYTTVQIDHLLNNDQQAYWKLTPVKIATPLMLVNKHLYSLSVNHIESQATNCDYIDYDKDADGLTVWISKDAVWPSIRRLRMQTINDVEGLLLPCFPSLERVDAYNPFPGYRYHMAEICSDTEAEQEYESTLRGLLSQWRIRHGFTEACELPPEKAFEVFRTVSVWYHETITRQGMQVVDGLYVEQRCIHKLLYRVWCSKGNDLDFKLYLSNVAVEESGPIDNFMGDFMATWRNMIEGPGPDLPPAIDLKPICDMFTTLALGRQVDAEQYSEAAGDNPASGCVPQ